MNSEFFKKNQGLIIALVIVVVLIVISISRDEQKASTDIKTGSEQEQNFTEPSSQESAQDKPQAEVKKTDSSTSAAGNLVREGQLLASDNQARGNYMIKTTTSVFYLKTSRDFSALINKEVKMIAEGTVEKFSLVDIVAK